MPPSEPDAENITNPARSLPSFALTPLPPFKPDLYERAWTSIPHPTLPLLATAHQKQVTVYSLSTLSAHSTLTGGHTRSVRSAAWKPNLGPQKLCLVTGSFDSTAGLWRWEGGDDTDNANNLEREVTAASALSGPTTTNSNDADSTGEKEWEFALVLEGHDSEVKSVSFSPGGQYLATCSRDKSVWIWEDVGAREADDEWETVAVLTEHEGDVKAVAWCPDVPNRSGRGRYAGDVLASAGYDDTVRVWREDGDGEWVCVAVLEGHAGTVWGVQWEPRPREDGFPRLLSWSADCTVRVWTLKEEGGEEEEDGQPRDNTWGGLGGGIPNTMRRSLKEDWACTAVLPQAHTRDVYSASWSAASGLVASTGSDGIIAVYGEDEKRRTAHGSATAVESDGDVHMTNGQSAVGKLPELEGSKAWTLLSSVPDAHGPYEVNHVTWCRRYDASCPSDRRGVEEMLVSTGDDGVVRSWQVSNGG